MWADGTEVTRGGHAEVCPIHREEFADRGMSRLFAERGWQFLLEMGDDYTMYPMLEDRDRVAGWRNSLVVSECGQKNLSPGADLNVDNFPKGVDGKKDWDFIGSIGGDSAQCVGRKRNLTNLQEECQTKKPRVPTNVAEAVELAQMLLRSADASVNTVLSEEVPVTTGTRTAELAAKLNKAKARIKELESIESITVRWHGELLDEVQQRRAEDSA